MLERFYLSRIAVLQFTAAALGLLLLEAQRNHLQRWPFFALILPLGILLAVLGTLPRRHNLLLFSTGVILYLLIGTAFTLLDVVYQTSQGVFTAKIGVWDIIFPLFLWPYIILYVVGLLPVGD
ncbi:MAG TPA: hypothetical protein VNL15_03865 [Dehalococcoidia bacterium]|nr:hypothetical protein [Dehalococcoidia bacterium]